MPIISKIVPTTAPIISPILLEPLAAGFGVGDTVGVTSPGISTSKVGAGVGDSVAEKVTVGNGVNVAAAVCVGKGDAVLAVPIGVSSSSSSGSSGASVANGSSVGSISSSDGSIAPAKALSCCCTPDNRGACVKIMQIRKIPIMVRVINKVLYEWSSLRFLI